MCCRIGDDDDDDDDDGKTSDTWLLGDVCIARCSSRQFSPTHQEEPEGLSRYRKWIETPGTVLVGAGRHMPDRRSFSRPSR